MVRINLGLVGVVVVAGLGTSLSGPGLKWTTVQAFQAQTSPREAYADLPGVRIWYTDTGGSGVPVVLLHAATGSSRVWEHQIPAFTKSGFRVIAYDRRGFGRTVIEAAGTQPGTGADDLQALLGHLGIDRFHLVSTAAGGFVAFDYALSFPQRLRSLVVANSIGGVQDEDFLEMGRRVRPTPQFNALPADVRELGPSYRVANPQGTQRWVDLERTSRAEGPPAAGADDEESSHVLDAGRDQGADAAAHGRCRPVRASGGASALCRPDQARTIGDRAGGRPLDVLGAAGDLQSVGPGVHPQALTS